MRHKSPTNSHPYSDDAAWIAYRDANHYCEIAKHFPDWGGGWTRIPGTTATIVRALDTPAQMTHHIGWGGQRWDRKWNMIRVGEHSHQFCHDFKWDGVALCLKEKIAKGEWDAADARQCLGFDLVGKLSCHECKFPFAEVIRLEIIEGRL